MDVKLYDELAQEAHYKTAFAWQDSWLMEKGLLSSGSDELRGHWLRIFVSLKKKNKTKKLITTQHLRCYFFKPKKKKKSQISEVYEQTGMQI